jgi:CRP-like cAMP-binding protein
MAGRGGQSPLPEVSNAIWDSLPTEARKAVESEASEVTLQAQRPFAAEEEGAGGIYFPTTCVICRLVTLPEGTSVKVSVIGREGMVGVPALIGSSMPAFRTVVQLPGRALFLPTAQAMRFLDDPRAAEILFRYVLLQFRETSLTAACNRSHRAKQRLARWLLLIRDRAGRDEFPLTHESISAMLGVRRESVTVAANELRRTGAIEYRRATMAITDRRELEKQSCSCYAAITAAYAQFLAEELDA